MPRTLTAQDRASLVRLASSLPVGSAERKAILAGLKTSTTDFESYDWQGFDSVDYNEYPPERVSKELSAVKKEESGGPPSRAELFAGVQSLERRAKDRTS